MTSATDKTRVFVAGHRGMVGSAIIRQLEQDPSIDILTRGRNELDLTNQAKVQQFFAETPIDQVYLAAAKVGGIQANNTYPAEFIYENLMIESNIINSAFHSGVKKLLFLGSSCIYPKNAEQPMPEECLLTGSLEPTNEPYAIAKIAGIKLCESFNRQYGESYGIDYRSVMPTNLYGEGDNYHPENSHVIPGLIQRFHRAKMDGLEAVCVWGSGRPRREFLHVNDMARASIFIMNLSKASYFSATSGKLSHINVGAGSDVTIHELSLLIADIVGYSGRIEFDESKPDGAPRKLMSSNRIINLGWAPSVELREGLLQTYQDYLGTVS